MSGPSKDVVELIKTVAMLTERVDGIRKEIDQLGENIGKERDNISQKKLVMLGIWFAFATAIVGAIAGAIAGPLATRLIQHFWPATQS